MSDLAVLGNGELATVPIGSGDSDFDAIAAVRFTEEDWTALGRLTQLQQRFILEYPRDFNGTAAAGRAGYQGGANALNVRASTLLRHPVAGRLIRKLCAATADEMGLTREWIMNTLQGLANEARADGAWQSSAKAVELIARLRGDMIERKQVHVRTVAITINGVDMEDLT